MTTQVSTSKAKSIVAFIGGTLTVVVPLILELQTYLPPQWQAIIGGVIALLTVFGVYQVPNKPTGAVVAPSSPPPVNPPPSTANDNPWY